MDGGEDRLSNEIYLVQKAKDLNAEAWAWIYDHHYSKIYFYLYRRLGDIHEAEDMAASVFLKALEATGSYEHRGISLSAWLFRIAHNTAVDHFRRKAKSTTEPLRAEMATEMEGPDKLAEVALEVSELRAALWKLTDEQRQVILLRFIAGLSSAEVSRIIKKSEGAVKTLQRRALASLRRIMRVGDQLEGRL